MSNTNIEQLYDYYLQQVVAESYLEKTSDYSGEGLRTRLRFGTNRDPINGRYRGYTRLTDAQIDEFIAKFDVVHQWSDNPTPSGSRPVEDGIHGNDYLDGGIRRLPANDERFEDAA